MTVLGPDVFADELRVIDYVVERAGEFVIFSYEVDVGPLDGMQLKIGLQPVGHPRSPPSGPFVNPRLLPLCSENRPAPHGGVYDAAKRGFPDPAGNWEYWSRPFNEWSEHGRTARSYLDLHLRRLFAGLPEDLVLACAA